MDFDFDCLLAGLRVLSRKLDRAAEVAAGARIALAEQERERESFKKGIRRIAAEWFAGRAATHAPAVRKTAERKGFFGFSTDATADVYAAFRSMDACERARRQAMHDDPMADVGPCLPLDGHKCSCAGGTCTCDD